MKCQECGGVRIKKLYDDPRTPPLDDKACLCVECFTAVTSELADAAEDEAGHWRQEIEKVRREPGNPEVLRALQTIYSRVGIARQIAGLEGIIGTDREEALQYCADDVEGQAIWLGERLGWTLDDVIAGDRVENDSGATAIRKAKSRAASRRKRKAKKRGR